MKTGVKLLLPLITFVLLVFAPSNTFAHPGNTAADGCHYCRTNCAKWGEVEDARHCHGGSSIPVYTAPETPAPTSKPVATASPIPVLKTSTSTPLPTATSSPYPVGQTTATEEPRVSAFSEEEKELTPSDWLIGLSVLGGMVAAPVWAGKKILRKI